MALCSRRTLQSIANHKPRTTSVNIHRTAHRTAKITFVGPLGYPRTKNAEGKVGAEFTILQDGGSLKLEYPSPMEAASARRIILGNPQAYAVPSNKVLGAIQAAIAQAQQNADQHNAQHPYLQKETYSQPTDVLEV